MDITSVSAIVMSVFSLLQPYLATISTKAAERIGEKVPDEIAALWHRVASGLGNSQTGKDATSDLVENPGDQDLQAAFRVQMKKALEQDDAFRREIAELIQNMSSQGGFTAIMHGNGAIAQGQGAKSVGSGGILVNGDENKIDVGPSKGNV